MADYEQLTLPMKIIYKIFEDLEETGESIDLDDTESRIGGEIERWKRTVTQQSIHAKKIEEIIIDKIVEGYVLTFKICVSSWSYKEGAIMVEKIKIYDLEIEDDIYS